MLMFCKYIQKLSPKIKPIEKKIINSPESPVKTSCLKNTPKLSPIKNDVFFILNFLFLIYVF